MLNSRQINLLCYLKKEQRFCPAREIAQVLGCSTKTVYNDIALLQKYISRNEWGGMDSKPNCGTRLFLSQKGIAALEREMNEAFLFTAQLEDCTDEIIPILRLLLRRQNVTAEELGNRLHASRSLIERHLSQAEEWLEGMKLHLVRRRGRGLCVLGEDIYIGIAEWYLFQEYYEALSEQRTTCEMDENHAIRMYLEGFDTGGVVRAIEAAETECGVTLAYDTYERLLFWSSLIVWYERRKLPKKNERKFELQSELEKRFLDVLERALQRNYSCRISGTGQAFLRFGISFAEFNRFSDEGQEIQFLRQNARLCNFVSRGSELMGRVLQADFSGDDLLEKQLFWGIRSITALGDLGIHQKYPVPNSLGETEPTVRTAVELLDGMCEQEYGFNFSRQETRYLEIIIESALKRNRTMCNVALICAHGMGITQVLREIIEYDLPQVSVQRCLSVREIGRLKASECDLAVSVVPLPYVPPGIEVVYVDMEHLDLTPLRKKISELSRCRVYIPKASHAVPYLLFSEQTVLADCDIKEKAMVLDELCTRLEEVGAVDSTYRNSVFQREKAAVTMLGKGLALPHGKGEHVIHSKIAVAIMRRPLNWGGVSEANIVMMAAFRMDQADAQPAILSFYRSAAKLMRGEYQEQWENLRRLDDPQKAAELLNELLGGGRLYEKS